MKRRALCAILALTLLIGLAGMSTPALAETEKGEAGSPRRETIFNSTQSGGYPVNAKTFGNSSIEAVILSNGRFGIGTRSETPNKNGSLKGASSYSAGTRYDDTYKRLLYGHPTGSTSYTTIRINDVNYTFSADTGSTPKYNAAGTEATSTMTIRENSWNSNSKVLYTVQQIITLVKNPITNREDMFRIRYKVTNKTGSAKRVGVRIMMDTCLGSVDVAPFQVPGIGDVRYEREFTGANIPKTYQAFADLYGGKHIEDPDIVAAGMFYRTASERPDKVQFAMWSGVQGTAWDYQINTAFPRSFGDSAVTATWNAKSLAKNATRTVNTYYGIGEIDFEPVRMPPVLMRVASPKTVDIDIETGDYYNPVQATAYIKNTGTTTVRDVQLKIEMNDPRVSLRRIVPKQGEGQGTISGNTITFASLEGGAEIAVDFELNAQTQTTARNVSYKLTLSANPLDLATGTVNPQVKNISLHLPVVTSVTAKASNSGGQVQINEGAKGAAQTVRCGTGTDITVTAYPKADYYFNGWYIGNTKKSSSLEYEFTAPVASATTLTARFVKKTALGKPKNLTFNTQKATWKTVKNNSGYTLKVMQGKKTVFTKQVGKNKKSYKFTKAQARKLQKGKTYKLTLVAKGTGKYMNSKSASKTLKA